MDTAVAAQTQQIVDAKSVLGSFEQVSRVLFEQSPAQKSAVALGEEIRNNDELLLLVFKLYEANTKERDLIQWAIKREIEMTKNVQEFLRDSSSLVIQFLFLQFFVNDLGKKYISNLITPLLEQQQHQESTSTSDIHDPMQAAESVVAKAEKFLDQMYDSIDSCPISLRESFCFLRKELVLKFASQMSQSPAVIESMNSPSPLADAEVGGAEDQTSPPSSPPNSPMFGGAEFNCTPSQMIASILFLRFICPTIINPSKYGLAEETSQPDESNPNESKKSKKSKKEKVERSSGSYSSNSSGSFTRFNLSDDNLVFFSRLLQKCANNSPFDVSKPHSERYNTFIEKNHSKILTYVEELLDESKIQTIKKIIAANTINGETMSTLSLKNGAAKKAEENFEQYLSLYHHLGKEIHLKLELKVEKEKLMEHYSSSIKEWKEIVSHRKTKIAVYTKKIEMEENTLTVFRSVGTLHCSMKSLYDLLHNWDHLAHYDPSISQCDHIQSYDEQHSEWYLQFKPLYPFTARDFVVTRHDSYGELQSVLSAFSVSREDRPEVVGCIRGEIYGSGFVLDKCGDDSTVLTYILCCDPHGSIPSYIAAKMANNHVAFLTNLLTFFEASRTPLPASPLLKGKKEKGTKGEKEIKEVDLKKKDKKAKKEAEKEEKKNKKEKKEE